MFHTSGKFVSWHRCIFSAQVKSWTLRLSLESTLLGSSIILISAMHHRGQDCIEHEVQPFADIDTKKTQDVKSILMQKIILSTVAAIGIGFARQATQEWRWQEAGSCNPPLHTHGSVCQTSDSAPPRQGQRSHTPAPPACLRADGACVLHIGRSFPSMKSAAPEKAYQFALGYGQFTKNRLDFRRFFRKSCHQGGGLSLRLSRDRWTGYTSRQSWRRGYLIFRSWRRTN